MRASSRWEVSLRRMRRGMEKWGSTGSRAAPSVLPVRMSRGMFTCSDPTEMQMDATRQAFCRGQVLAKARRGEMGSWTQKRKYFCQEKAHFLPFLQEERELVHWASSSMLVLGIHQARRQIKALLSWNLYPVREQMSNKEINKQGGFIGGQVLWGK